MNVVTSSAAALEVGVRELKTHLSRYLDRVASGEQVVVTDHGRPVARLIAIEPAIDRLAALVAAGTVRPPTTPERRRPAQRIVAAGGVGELVAEQRR